MPDLEQPAAPAETAATPAPETPAVQTSTPAPAPAQPAHDTINPADLDHPEWGPKLRTLQDRERKAHGKIGEYEGKVRTYEQQIQYARTLIAQPAVAERVVAYLKSTGQSVPPQLAEIAAKAKEPPEGEEPSEIEQLKAQLAELRKQVSVDSASHAQIMEMGNGDFLKGRQLYHEALPELHAILGEMGQADDRMQLALAQEILRARKSRAAPPPPAVPVQTPPSGTATPDMGRGTARQTPAPQNGEAFGLQDWLKAAGFKDELEYAAAQRSEGEAT